MSASEIALVNRSFEDAVRRGDAGAIAQVYAADALVLPPDEAMIAGREAIQTYWQSVIAEHGLKAADITSLALDVHGENGNEVGRCSLSFADGSTVEVKFLAVWCKIGGRWYIQRDIWNGMPPS
jgi:ketosteroid isomerase-like protein